MNEREQLRDNANRQELIERIGRAIREDGTVQPASGLHLYRASAPTGWIHSVADPAFCVIAQGSKEVYVGEDRYRYDPAHYLLGTVELPIVSQIVQATRPEPYLSLRLDLEPVLVGSVMVEAGLGSPRGQGEARGIDVNRLDPHLLDATVRLVRLLDAPDEMRVMAPLIKREIVFRLLTGAQGARLRHIAVVGGNSHRIARAVERMRQEYDRPLRIDDLARDLGMSASGFHHQFKAVTAMSPLQYQKQIRLQEARRLMFGEDMDAASAGFRVGYEDPSHFSREYKRLFGAPPMRDVERLRGQADSFPSS